MQLTNRTYDGLKFVALVLLPGISAVYFGLGQIWGFPYVEQVVGTIAVIDTFAGLILKASTSQYKKADKDVDGDLLVEESDGEKFLALGVKGRDIESMTTKDTVRLRVVDNSAPRRGRHA